MLEFFLIDKINIFDFEKSNFVLADNLILSAFSIENIQMHIWAYY